MVTRSQPGRAARHGAATSAGAAHAAAVAVAAQRASRDYVRAEEIRQREEEAEAFLASITGINVVGRGRVSRAQSTTSSLKIR